jgi:alcohol dehydrogenase class IV
LLLLKLQVLYFSNNNNARILTTIYAPKVLTAIKMLASALPESNGDAIQGLNTLLAKTIALRSLKAFSMSESDIDKAADIAVSNAYWNHRVVERDLIREIIRRAWAREDARADL